MDSRLRVLRDADAGVPSDALAETYSVSRAWVDRLKQRRRETVEVAPAVFDRPIDGPSFRACNEQALVPTLHRGDIVVMDNLACHKVHGIAEASTGAGAELWNLPPCRPDLNPIELSFAKLKTILRATRCRTVAHLWATTGASLTRFAPEECRN